MKTAIARAIARFPQYFGLTGHSGRVFRLDAASSYETADGLVLYAQSLFSVSELPTRDRVGHEPHGTVWLDFAKGTETELLGQLTSVPDRWLEIIAAHADCSTSRRQNN